MYKYAKNYTYDVMDIWENIEKSYNRKKYRPRGIISKLYNRKVFIPWGL